jgi:Nucleoside-diphosphate-sugar epimerases
MVDRLRGDKHDVFTLDRMYGASYSCDISSGIPLNYLACNSFDWVFHFAGLAAIPPSMTEPANYMAVNAQGTANVLDAAKKLGAKRFIYAASGTCYGFNPPQPTPESAPIACETTYALSKWLGEEMVRHWDRVFDLPSVSLRLFNPYGPGMGLTSALGHFLRFRREGKPITITGDGEQYRDMHYVSDCVEAFYLAAKSDIRDVVINIGSGKPQTINALVRALGVTDIRYVPPRREAPGTHAGISLAKRLLGWEPKVSFEDGIQRTLQGG